jgi:hypothetical protein
MNTIFAKTHETQKAVKRPSRNPTTLDSLKQGVARTHESNRGHKRNHSLGMMVVEGPSPI